MARAVTQGVYGTGTVNLGDLDPESGPVTQQITWTNTTGQDVELDLELDVTDLSGDAPASGALTLGADSVTVPAGATATVPLTVDPARLDHGRYAGQLVATGGDVTVHTTVGVVKSAPTHEVTLRAVGFDGESITATPVIFVGEDPRFDTLVHVWKDTTKTVELGEGDYYMSALVTPDVYDEDSAVALIDPDFEVTEDRELVLDARKAVRVEIDTPKPAVLRGNLGYTSYRAARGRTFYHSVMEFDSTTSIWVTPTERAKGGIFEFTSRWQLAEPLLSARTSGAHPLRFRPRYERSSPAVVDAERLEVVPVGEGLPEDYEGVDVAGKIAMVKPEDKGGEDIDAAVAAGAAMMLIVPKEGTQWWTKYTGRGPRLPIPVLVLSARERDQLTERLARGRVSLNIDGVPDSRYTYDVVQVAKDRVPQRVLHTVSSHNSATVTANYHEMGGEPWAKEQRYAWRPWQQSTVVENQQEVRTPQSRIETISSGSPDTLWRQHVLHFFSWDLMNPINGGAVHALRTYRPRERVSYDWWGSVVRPAVPTGAVPTRTGDGLLLQIAELAGNGGTTYDRSTASDTTMALYEDGQLLATDDHAWGTYTATAGTGRLPPRARRQPDQGPAVGVLHDDRHEPGSSSPPGRGLAPRTCRCSRSTTTSRSTWTTRSGAGASRRLGFSVGYAGRPEARVRVADVDAWISYDDGDSWQRLSLRWQRRLQERDRAAPAGRRLRIAAGPGRGPGRQHHRPDGGAGLRRRARLTGVEPPAPGHLPGQLHAGLGAGHGHQLADPALDGADAHPEAAGDRLVADAGHEQGQQLPLLVRRGVGGRHDVDARGARSRVERDAERRGCRPVAVEQREQGGEQAAVADQRRGRLRDAVLPGHQRAERDGPVRDGHPDRQRRRGPGDLAGADAEHQVVDHARLLEQLLLVDDPVADAAGQHRELLVVVARGHRHVAGPAEPEDLGAGAELQVAQLLADRAGPGDHLDELVGVAAPGGGTVLVGQLGDRPARPVQRLQAAEQQRGEADVRWGRRVSHRFPVDGGDQAQLLQAGQHLLHRDLADTEHVGEVSGRGITRPHERPVRAFLLRPESSSLQRHRSILPRRRSLVGALFLQVQRRDDGRVVGGDADLPVPHHVGGGRVEEVHHTAVLDVLVAGRGHLGRCRPGALAVVGVHVATEQQPCWRAPARWRRARPCRGLTSRRATCSGLPGCRGYLAGLVGMCVDTTDTIAPSARFSIAQVAYRSQVNAWPCR